MCVMERSALGVRFSVSVSLSARLWENGAHVNVSVTELDRSACCAGTERNAQRGD